MLAQINSAQGANPGAFSSDALTQAILDRLKEEVAKVYAEAGGEAPGSPRGGAEGGAGGGAASSVRVRATPAVGPLAEGPWMHNLWKASHEVERPKQKVRAVGTARPTRARAPRTHAHALPSLHPPPPPTLLPARPAVR